ncbi:MAG TPA: tetratricopeptide repeat protein [Gemmataceae bacterium]|nr:tetratricopeptide repeat protein [Gemmataceae bacterium]
MLQSVGGMVRRRAGTALVLAVLLTAGGAGAGFCVHVHRQWHAAEADVRAGRLEEAQARLGICLRVWPRDARVHLLAARAARLRGDFETAEAHLNQCIQLEGEAGEATQIEFLLMRVQRGEVDEVAPVLLNIVEDGHPEAPLILETLSRAYMHNLRYGPALRSLNLWIREAPDAATPYHWRGWVLERINDSRSAMKDYERALELDPDLFPARLRLAEMWLERSNPPEALPHLEYLMRQSPERPEVPARLGQCRLLQGKPEEARRLLEAAVEALPDDAAVRISLARLEIQQGRPEKAEPHLRHVLKSDPTDTDARFTLIACLQAQGRREEAAAAAAQYQKDTAMLKEANRLLQNEADRPTRDPDAAYKIGALFLRAGQERLGLYWLHQALERDAHHQPTHRTLAELYEQKGDRKNAAAHRRMLAPPRKKAAPPRAEAPTRQKGGPAGDR